MKNFDIWVDEDRIQVRFVSRKTLGHIKTGHSTGGDYGDKIVRLQRYETRRCLSNMLFHEMGHYLVEREELLSRGKLVPELTDEDVCDLMTWWPGILADPRNTELRKFLNLV